MQFSCMLFCFLTHQYSFFSVACFCSLAFVCILTTRLLSWKHRFLQPVLLLSNLIASSPSYQEAFVKFFDLLLPFLVACILSVCLQGDFLTSMIPSSFFACCLVILVVCIFCICLPAFSLFHLMGFVLCLLVFFPLHVYSSFHMCFLFAFLLYSFQAMFQCLPYFPDLLVQYSLSIRLLVYLLSYLIAFLL